jgi:hypothetical protein
MLPTVCLPFFCLPVLRAKLPSLTIQFPYQSHFSINFLTGWVPDETGSDVWGRPVGVTVIKDGSLLVVDDGGKKIWRVTYGKK